MDELTARLVPDLRKIAVLRCNALGDLIAALPAREALRHAYPAAQITLLARDWHVEFLAGRPGPVDRVEVVPPTPGLNLIETEAETAATRQTRAEFFARMQAERFDLAVQIHGGGRYSNPFVRQLGARLTIGLVDRDAPPLDR